MDILQVFFISFQYLLTSELDALKDHASIIVSDRLYIYDGRRDDHCQEIWYWDLKLHAWKNVTPQRGLLPTFIKGGSLNLLGDNHILVYGGENSKDLVFYEIGYIAFY